MSVVITALIIVAVILFNVIFSALASKFLWHVDLTREGLYSLSDNCKELLKDTFDDVSESRREQGITEPLKVTIKFCDMEDNIMEVTAQRYVLMTARELADRFPDFVDIQFINIWENPTAVEKYKTSVHSVINSSDVIVESGTEYRIYKAADFYLTSKGASNPWAYFGEKRFASAILAVTQAESPVAGVLTGHGEVFSDAELVYLLELAGFEVQIIDDLVNTTLPENCRLLVCFNPTSDFLAADGISDISEIAVLDDFLAGENHSLMVFMSPSSPILPNLENYLDLWGISFGRHTDFDGTISSCTVKDSDNALTGDGLTFIGEYETMGFGATVTEDMRSVKNPRRVVFKNAMPITISDAYETSFAADKETGAHYAYGYKSLGNGFSRQVFNIFTAADSSVLMSGGKQVEKANANDPYGLMTISMHYRATQEETNADYFENADEIFADQSSYVLACGSTDFVTETLIQSGTYGNSEALLHALLTMGKEPVPTSLEFTPFSDTTIDTLTLKRANAYTVSLTVIPAITVFAIGIFVIVRRKHA